MSDTLLELVPHLRRYAYLLTGSKGTGDEYVCLCLERVTAEPEWLEGHDEPLVALCRALYVTDPTAESEDDPLANLVGTYEERLRVSLTMLPLLERWAVLLGVTAEMPSEQIAYVLGLKVEGARRLLAEGRRRLRDLVANSVLIIEDEPLIAMELNGITSAMGFTSARLVSTVAEAVSAALSDRPSLVLADLKLHNDENGIEAAKAILEESQVPIVFVTGYPERLDLVVDQELEPTFVVLKPFRYEQLQRAVDYAMETYASPEKAAAHRELMLSKFKQLEAA